MKLLHINQHKHADSAGPFFVLVDADLFERLSSFRWITSSSSARPFRVYYCREKGGAKTETMARHVWEIAKGEPEPFIAHSNGDLLDCRASNLVKAASKKHGRIDQTGKSFVPPDVAFFRKNNGLSIEGVPAKRGRPLPGTQAQHAQIREIRASVGADMTLRDFNREVVAAELGRPLSWRALKKLLADDRKEAAKTDGSSDLA